MVKPPAKTVAEYKQNLKNVFFNIENPEMLDEPMQMVISLLRYFDELEIQQIRAQNGDDTCETQTDLDTTIDSNMTEQSKKTQNKPRIIDGLAENRDSVLIFVPGMQQINNLTDLINKELPGRKLNVLPLHSDIVIEQQVRVFERSEPTWRKVIISTSIAESSITVSDIKYVIDFGLTKELFCDPFTGYTHLRLEWASQSSMNQRRGRAGRVSNGTCYRLIPKRFFDELDPYTKVERNLFYL
jgi:HrpA-like RNA helicase